MSYLRTGPDPSSTSLPLAYSRERAGRKLPSLPAGYSLRRAVVRHVSDLSHAVHALRTLVATEHIQFLHPLVGGHLFLAASDEVQFSRLARCLEGKRGQQFRIFPSYYEMALWIGGDAAAIDRFIRVKRLSIARDVDGRSVFLAHNQWTLNRVCREWPDINFCAGPMAEGERA
ncbi:hypothetical protein [Ancylobacter sp. TS-1]|uniref:hypothetical protein n=1 Tax=Ancylobacter sp. TS-1 TaxID=1850374 RepID=UPI001265D481|nr:hypothetical protein [Ancylobacter sp. TS-1]QFR34690.1 hypothetical protein GBB76_17150 [Ancylobacter sp. TS-1]